MKKESTKETLAYGFKELVKEMPIDKITIKDITDRAGVIRPTFYNHFQDKYDLLEWIIINEIINPVVPLFQGGFIKEAMILIFTNMIKDKDFYTQAAKSEGQNSFSSIVKNLIEAMILQYINMKVGTNVYFHRWMPPEMIAEYYAEAIKFLTLKWTTTGMSIPPKEMATLCDKVFESNLDEMINEMK